MRTTLVWLASLAQHGRDAKTAGVKGANMRIANLTAVLLLGVASPAFAQSSSVRLGETAREVYSSCLTVGKGADLSTACACLTGYLGGVLDDRDLEITAFLLRIGEMADRGVPEADIQSEVYDFFSKGFSEADVQRVAALVEQISARGDIVCGQFEPAASV